MWCTLVDHHGQLQSDDIAGLLDLHLCRYVQERDLYMEARKKEMERLTGRSVSYIDPSWSPGECYIHFTDSLR